MPKARYRIIKRSYTYKGKVHTSYIPQHRSWLFGWSYYEHYEGTTPMTTQFGTLADAERFLKEENEGIEEVVVKEYI
jgi:hypothetical protein